MKNLSTWHNWFAWKPITTVGGSKVWLKTIYRKIIFSEMYGFSTAIYCQDEFEILKYNELYSEPSGIQWSSQGLTVYGSLPFSSNSAPPPHTYAKKK